MADDPQGKNPILQAPSTTYVGGGENDVVRRFSPADDDPNFADYHIQHQTEAGRNAGTGLAFDGSSSIHRLDSPWKDVSLDAFEKEDKKGSFYDHNTDIKSIDSAKSTETPFDITHNSQKSGDEPYNASGGQSQQYQEALSPGIDSHEPHVNDGYNLMGPEKYSGPDMGLYKHIPDLGPSAGSGGGGGSEENITNTYEGDTILVNVAINIDAIFEELIKIEKEILKLLREERNHHHDHHEGGQGQHGGNQGHHEGGQGQHSGNQGHHEGGQGQHGGNQGHHEGGQGQHGGNQGHHEGGQGQHSGNQGHHEGGQGQHGGNQGHHEGGQGQHGGNQGHHEGGQGQHGGNQGHHEGGQGQHGGNQGHHEGGQGQHSGNQGHHEGKKNSSHVDSDHITTEHDSKKAGNNHSLHHNNLNNMDNQHDHDSDVHKKEAFASKTGDHVLSGFSDKSMNSVESNKDHHNKSGDNDVHRGSENDWTNLAYDHGHASSSSSSGEKNMTDANIHEKHGFGQNMSLPSMGEHDTKISFDHVEKFMH